MLHAAFHWPERANIKLWPQAIDYAVWVFNRLPSIESRVSPNEIWSRSRNTSHDLRRTHPFGCLVFVLDPALQDGNKLPKWSTRARQGMFVGFSANHSLLVPLILNVTTGKISPQFHIVFDDKFQTALSLPMGQTLSDEWLNILQFQTNCFLDVDDNDDDKMAAYPPEFSDWLHDNRITPTHTENPILRDQEHEGVYDQTPDDVNLEIIPAPEGVSTPEPIVSDDTAITQPTRKNPP